MFDDDDVGKQFNSAIIQKSNLFYTQVDFFVIFF